MQFDQQCFKKLHYILLPFILSHTNGGGAGSGTDFAPKLTVFIRSVFFFFLTFNVNLDKTIVDILNDEFSGVD